MIALINSSAFRPQGDQEGSKGLSDEECQKFWARYNGSKIRLWKYNCSLSRLVLKVEQVQDERLLPIDLVFVGLRDV